MENTKNHAYQKELFDRLRKSQSLKRAEECFARVIKGASWWLLEKRKPSLQDVEEVICRKCPLEKGLQRRKIKKCAKNILGVITRAAEEKTIIKFDCEEGLHGFVSAIAQADKIYGYVGGCYRKKDISTQILQIFSAFLDTIIKEAQKEMELSKLYETLRPRAIALSTVHTVHRLISSTLDFNELLPRIARLSLQIMRAQRCSIKLVDSKRKVLLPKVTVDLRQKNIRLKKVRVGRWAPGKAVKFGRPIRGRDYLATPLI
ncbi:MAG: hypothetical protein NC933_00630, partial [Candidatus Omnitrophica bacterium]|nr:hypothetical protein [Candidatus Omnitrophota bacterium]